MVFLLSSCLPTNFEPTPPSSLLSDTPQRTLFIAGYASHDDAYNVPHSGETTSPTWLARCARAPTPATRGRSPPRVISSSSTRDDRTAITPPISAYHRIRRVSSGLISSALYGMRGGGRLTRMHDTSGGDRPVCRSPHHTAHTAAATHARVGGSIAPCNVSDGAGALGREAML